MKKLFLFFILLSFTIERGYSGNSRLYDSGQLSCSLISTICQDDRGFIWIGTVYGLNKFDGVQFTQYLNRENDANSLLGDIVNKLYVDKEHCLWVGCSKGVQYYLPEKDAFCTVPFEDNLTPNVTDIVQLQNGEIWIATSGRGIFKIDREKNKVVALDEINKLCVSYMINHIYEDRFNRIWICTERQGIVCLDSSGEKIANYSAPDLPKTSANMILEDKEGTLFVASAGAVFMFDEVSGRFISVKSRDGRGVDVREMTLTKEGVIYLSTYGKGVYSINKEELLLAPVENIHSPFLNMKTAKVVAMIEDSNQNLWIGCFQKGVVMIPNRPMAFGFWNLSEKEFEMGGTVTCVYRDSQGFVWGGMENGGLYKFNAKGEVVDHIVTSQTVISICEDSEHAFWIGTYYNGLARVDTRRGECRFYPQFGNGRIKSLVEDSRKNLYVAIFGGGVKGYHLPTQTMWELAEKVPESRKMMKNSWVNVLLCDSKDMIWIGHYKGVNCYDARNDCFLEVKGDSVLNSRVCYSLLEDHKGNIWIGTNNGLYMWHRTNSSLISYSTDDGLSNNVICGLAEDKEGNIWCSTFRGINQIKVSEGL